MCLDSGLRSIFEMCFYLKAELVIGLNFSNFYQWQPFLDTSGFTPVKFEPISRFCLGSHFEQI